MSAERQGPRVHELSRQFGGEPAVQRSPSPLKKLPKVLSHIPKVAVADAGPADAKPPPPVKPSFLAPPPPPKEEETAADPVVEAVTESVGPDPDFPPPVVSTPSPVKQSNPVSPPQTSPQTSPQKMNDERFVPPPPPPLAFNCSVGLDQLEEQVHRIAFRKGFALNLMVIGRSGLGKSTLINTLFRSSILPPERSVDSPVTKTVEIRTTQTTIMEKGIKLQLTVTDTPGFGDQIDNTNCWQPALDFIDAQYEKYLVEELSPDRMRHIRDTRIHCCLYFIPPTGHGLRSLDLEVLKRLHNVVNVVPVIAKADTLTLEEREEFKINIRKELEDESIEVYPSTSYEHEEDDVINQAYRELVPFAVCGSLKIHDFNGQSVLGRQNSWGLVQIEDPKHCEFFHLKELLIRHRMQDLIELTSVIHYENYRRRRLMEMKALSEMISLNESHI